jgi:hypothetical protein
MTKKTIRVGGACGFWGDTSISTPQLLQGGNPEYLVYDYLAEVTMSIMARARAKNPAAGFAADFVDTVGAHLQTIADRGIKVIANAGGGNPLACARALEAKIAEAGLDIKVGVVVGDDLLDRAAELKTRKVREMFTGAPMPDAPWSINAYLGAWPIAAALGGGAQIVVTGRCVDSALTLGACIHAFSWSAEDLDPLAGGSLAGHIIECGAQTCGGLHTDWEETGDWSNIGFPIAEISVDGSFVISKPAGTGGVVRFGAVAEQMVYEIGDPKAYLLPDVVCDFSGVRIEEVAQDEVRVSGAKGYPPTPSYKVSITYQEGYRVGQYLTVCGIDAVRKAHKVAADVITRCERLLQSRNLPPFTETSVEVIGSEGSYGAHARTAASREVILKVAAKHPQEAALNMLTRELTSSATSMAPGIAGMGGNRPKVSPVVRHFSSLIDKSEVPVTISVAGKTIATPVPVAGPSVDISMVQRPTPLQPASLATGAPTVPLVTLAYGRSGDKGDNANIGIIARRADFLPFIRAALTTDVVADVFSHYQPRRVERFDLPGINALNFLLHDVLGGGGVASLRNDPQAKTYAQILLDTPVAVTPEIAAEVGGVGLETILACA